MDPLTRSLRQSISLLCGSIGVALLLLAGCAGLTRHAATPAPDTAHVGVVVGSVLDTLGRALPRPARVCAVRFVRNVETELRCTTTSDSGTYQLDSLPNGSGGYVSYVRWHATVTGPGHYGHLGGSPFWMAVDSAIEMRAPSVSDCR